MMGPLRGPPWALPRSCSPSTSLSLCQGAPTTTFGTAVRSSHSASSGTRNSNRQSSSNSSSSSGSGSSSSGSGSSSSGSGDSPFSLLLLQQSKVFVRRCSPRALGFRKKLTAETRHTNPRSKSNRSSSSSSNTSGNSGSSSSRSSGNSSSSRRQQQGGVSHVSELLCRVARRQLRAGNVCACVSSIEAAARLTLMPLMPVLSVSSLSVVFSLSLPLCSILGVSLFGPFLLLSLAWFLWSVHSVYFSSFLCLFAERGDTETLLLPSLLLLEVEEGEAAARPIEVSHCLSLLAASCRQEGTGVRQGDTLAAETAAAADGAARAHTRPPRELLKQLTVKAEACSRDASPKTLLILLGSFCRLGASIPPGLLSVSLAALPPFVLNEANPHDLTTLAAFLSTCQQQILSHIDAHYTALQQQQQQQEQQVLQQNLLLPYTAWWLLLLRRLPSVVGAFSAVSTCGVLHACTAVARCCPQLQQQQEQQRQVFLSLCAAATTGLKQQQLLLQELRQQMLHQQEMENSLTLKKPCWRLQQLLLLEQLLRAAPQALGGATPAQLSTVTHDAALLVGECEAQLHQLQQQQQKQQGQQQHLLLLLRELLHQAHAVLQVTFRGSGVHAGDFSARDLALLLSSMARVCDTPQAAAAAAAGCSSGETHTAGWAAKLAAAERSVGEERAAAAAAAAVPTEAAAAVRIAAAAALPALYVQLNHVLQQSNSRDTLAFLGALARLWPFGCVSFQQQQRPRLQQQQQQAAAELLLLRVAPKWVASWDVKQLAVAAADTHRLCCCAPAALHAAAQSLLTQIAQHLTQSFLQQMQQQQQQVQQQHEQQQQQQQQLLRVEPAAADRLLSDALGGGACLGLTSSHFAVSTQQVMSLWVSLLSFFPRPSSHEGLLRVLEALISASLAAPQPQQQQLLLLLLQQQQHQRLLQCLRELPPPDDPSLTGSCIVRGLAALAGGGLPPQGLVGDRSSAGAAAAPAAAAPAAAASSAAAAAAADEGAPTALPLLPLLLARCEQQLFLLSTKDLMSLCRALLHLSSSPACSSHSNGSSSSHSSNGSSSSHSSSGSSSNSSSCCWTATRALKAGALALLRGSLAGCLLQKGAGNQDVLKLEREQQQQHEQQLQQEQQLEREQQVLQLLEELLQRFYLHCCSFSVPEMTRVLLCLSQNAHAAAAAIAAAAGAAAPAAAGCAEEGLGVAAAADGATLMLRQVSRQLMRKLPSCTPSAALDVLEVYVRLAPRLRLLRHTPPMLLLQQELLLQRERGQTKQQQRRQHQQGLQQHLRGTHFSMHNLRLLQATAPLLLQQLPRLAPADGGLAAAAALTRLLQLWGAAQFREQQLLLPVLQQLSLVLGEGDTSSTADTAALPNSAAAAARGFVLQYLPVATAAAAASAITRLGCTCSSASAEVKAQASQVLHLLFSSLQYQQQQQQSQHQEQSQQQQQQSQQPQRLLQMAAALSLWCCDEASRVEQTRAACLLLPLLAPQHQALSAALRLGGGSSSCCSSRNSSIELLRILARCLRDLLSLNVDVLPREAQTMYALLLAEHEQQRQQQQQERQLQQEQQQQQQRLVAAPTDIGACSSRMAVAQSQVAAALRALRGPRGPSLTVSENVLEGPYTIRVALEGRPRVAIEICRGSDYFRVAAGGLTEALVPWRELRERLLQAREWQLVRIQLEEWEALRKPRCQEHFLRSRVLKP
ncbi:hypothetical protein Esti_003863 [Eimeria stiedai]